MVLPRLSWAQGQQGSGTPYSAYGLGDLTGSVQVSQALMAGTSVAVYDPFSVVRANPASYVSLGRTTFETGLALRFLRFDTESRTAKGQRSDLLGFSLGIPFGGNRWGLAFGLNPESEVGYTINDPRALPDGSGTVNFQYRGSGGLSRAFGGLAHRVWVQKDTLKAPASVSLGLNYGYLFGSLDATRRAFYPANQGYYNTIARSTFYVGGGVLDLGMHLNGTLIGEERMKERQARHREALLKKDSVAAEAWLAAGKDPDERIALRSSQRIVEPLRFRLGAALESPLNVGVRRDELINNFITSGSGVEFNQDTARFIEGERGTLGLPLQLSLGLTLYDSRWQVSLEHRRRDWSELEVDLEDIDLSDQVSLATNWALGASFRPAGQRQGSYLENIIYRAGVRTSQDYLVVAGSNLKEIGMSFGMSLPIWNSTTRSRFNLGAEFGERGTISTGLVRERFTNLYFGITITPDLREPWMQKRRIE